HSLRIRITREAGQGTPRWLQRIRRGGPRPLPAAGCLRPLPQVFASFQSAGCPRRDLHDRTCRTDGPRAHPRLPHLRGLPCTNGRLRIAARGAAMKAAAVEKRVELLFEVGCEEIPAGMLPKAEQELRTNIEKLLIAENLFDGVSVETFGTPRRLVAWVQGLRAKQPDVEVEVTGPPTSVAYDSVGAPTRGAHSFAEKQGVHVSDLYLVETAKCEYLAAKQAKLGRTAEQILVTVLPRAVHDLAWPRSMTWTGLDGAR